MQTTFLQDLHRFFRETFKIDRDRHRAPREQVIYAWLIVGLFAFLLGALGILIWLGFLLGGWVWWFLIPYLVVIVLWCFFVGWWEDEYLV